MNNNCLVCGYDQLEEPQYVKEVPSYEICPFCGFEAGFDDDAASYPLTIPEYRAKWLKNSTSWFAPTDKPENWALKEQLKNINFEV
ncbi:hypothetical protein [Paenibacillus bovis]|uniref:Cysteine-rich CPCC domain-containing protein n=1 Tax=Paenibacillus bovis TaxID=1616788 RepID=A0A172ZFN4_9BACL|nr:hypothetical protein [Paenibacillus bovis]ANF95960.1 hypothetical protein AR543_08030 [Paenibacillus bovis]